MNYNQIKDYVLRVDTKLRLLPLPLVNELLGLLDPTPEVWNLGFYDLEVPGVKCIVHALNELDSRRYYTSCTITVDDVGAFFFTAGGREGGDFYRTYILDTGITKEFIRRLVMLSLEQELVVIDDLQVTPLDEEVVDASEECTSDSEPLHYGEYWSSYNPDQIWVRLKD